MKKLSAAVALVLASTTAMADYQGEVFASYENSNSGDTDWYFIGGTYHFSSVSTDSHPFAEAAFLERSNSISLAYSQTSQKDADDEDAVSAEVAIYIPQAMLYVAPFYTYTKSKFEGDSSSDNYWGVTAGLTPIDGLRITTTWVDDIDYDLNFDVKYVLKLVNDTAINLEFGFYETDEGGEDFVSAAIDYYFDRTFSVGLEVEDQHESVYGIRTRKFFTENFSAYAAYRNGDDNDSWLIGASFRF